MKGLRNLDSVRMSDTGVIVTPKGITHGPHGNQFFSPSPFRTALFDDFIGVPTTAALANTATAGNGGWISFKGSDADAVLFTYTAAPEGTLVGTIGTDATTTMAVTGTQLFHKNLQWKANQGDIYLQARVKISRITDIGGYFIGFTDQVGALEAPVISAAAANTITTNATDAVGFMFDTAMSTDNWWLVGVANDVDATAQNSALAPVADTYATFGILLDTSGRASFFYNGNPVGQTMTGAVTATVALAPTVCGFNLVNSGAPTITVDYLHVSGLRP